MIYQRPTKTITEAYTTTDADNGYRIICDSSSDFEITLHTATGRYNFDIEVDNVGAGDVAIEGHTLKQYAHAHVGNSGGAAWSVVVSGGVSEDYTCFTAEAGESIGGHRIVAMNSDNEAIYPTDYMQAVGLSLNAASEGADVTIATSGRIYESSWTWTPGSALYLTSSGIMTHTPPTSGVLLKLGYAITATSIFLKIDTPIQL